jgi:hypothetical protein
MLAHLGHGGRLVYNLPATDAIYQRFVGINGSAYFVGGLGMTAVAFDNIVVVPIRSGVGLRLGRQCRISEIHARAKGLGNRCVSAMHSSHDTDH